MRKMMAEKAAKYFAEGNNCCQSVLLVANDLWHLEISRDVIDAAYFLREGMASGCSCGALVGMEMVLGLLQKKGEVSIKKEKAKELHDAFVKTFGSSCCRALKKKQGLIERTTKQGCRKITAETAGILYELVKE
jgi:C_GCAxxG_C_C family probable redox protein